MNAKIFWCIGFFLLHVQLVAAHCVESPGVQCVDDPCHHPESIECRGEREQTQRIETTVNKLVQTTETPIWIKLGNIVAGVLAINAAAEETKAPARIKEVHTTLDELEKQLGKKKLANPAPLDKEAQPLVKNSDKEIQVVRDPLVRVIPPLPGSGAPSVPVISLASTQLPTKLDLPYLQKVVTDHVRKVADVQGKLQAAAVPSGAEVKGTLAAPTFASPKWILNRHEIKMGESFEQLQRVEELAREMKTKSTGVKSQDIETENLNTTLDQTLKLKKDLFGK